MFTATIIILCLPPLRSYDGRSGGFWHAGSSLTRSPGYQGRLSLNISGGAAALSLARVQRNDSGVFTCRVDFQDAPSKNSDVVLNVYGEL